MSPTTIPDTKTWTCTVIDGAGQRHSTSISAWSLSGVYAALDVMFPVRRAEILICLR